MIVMYTAFTTEIDEIDDALDEIFGSIEPERLRKNSVGLISCYPEFIESGVVAALCGKLPFEVIGMTSVSQAAPGFGDKYGLCLTVLTSDDAVFSVARTRPVSADDIRAPIAEAYGEAKAGLQGEPAFIISYFPHVPGVSGDSLLGVFDEVCGGVPIFGGVYMGDGMEYENGVNIYNGESAGDFFAMLLIQSDETPEFCAVALPERNIRGTKAMVTDSDGSLIKTINEVSMREHLETIGYIGLPQNMMMLVYYPGNSTPVVTCVYELDAEGGGICGAKAPVGASIAFGEATKENVLETVDLCLATALGKGSMSGALFSSCGMRYFTLMPRANEEERLIADTLDDVMPYMISYSRGEICPVSSDDGVLKNRFHSYSLCSCIF